MTEAARTAFALSRSSSDFLDATVLLTFHVLESKGTMPVDSLYRALQEGFHLERDDVANAIRVLKSPCAFKSLAMWRGKRDSSLLVKTDRTEEFSVWERELLAAKPHLQRFAQVV